MKNENIIKQIEGQEDDVVIVHQTGLVNINQSGVTKKEKEPIIVVGVKEATEKTAKAFDHLSREIESLVRFVEDKKNFHKELKDKARSTARALREFVRRFAKGRSSGRRLVTEKDADIANL